MSPVGKYRRLMRRDRLPASSRAVFSSDLRDDDYPERHSATWAREPAQSQHHPRISVAAIWAPIRGARLPAYSIRSFAFASSRM
jgi:hypothetical protein